MRRLLWLAAAAWLSACGFSAAQDKGEQPQPTGHSSGEDATVRAVSVTGVEGAFTFGVEIASPDSGCDHYADWWEVVDPDGRLMYRRVLLHSHVDEQPFTRTGGPVPVSPDQDLIIRVHMHPEGYARSGMRGSVSSGFAPDEIPADFAADLETSPPLPDDCAF